MILLEIAGGIILAGIVLAHWRHFILILVGLMLGSTVLLNVLAMVGR